MKIIFMASIALLFFALAIGLSLQSLGISIHTEPGLLSTYWPFLMVLGAGLYIAVIAYLNRATIWQTQAPQTDGQQVSEQKADQKLLKKSQIRPAIALLFAPMICILTLSYLWFDHLGIATKDGFNLALTIGTLTFFLVMGNYATSLEPGSKGGFRTPWTVRSAHIWHKTHRFIGRGITGVSVLGIVLLMFISAKSVFYIHLGAVILIKGAAMLYSYVCWRAFSKQSPHTQ